MLRNIAVIVAVFIASSTASLAQPLPLPLPPLINMEGTPEDRAACAPDVHRYCERAIPDNMRVLACLQANRQRISPACRGVLEKYGQ